MSKDTPKVATFNVNWVRMRLDLVAGWLQKERPDALGLQEIKVRDGEFPADAFNAVGYRAVSRRMNIAVYTGHREDAQGPCRRAWPKRAYPL